MSHNIAVSGAPVEPTTAPANPPPKKRACDECRAKKLKCTKELDGCTRCKRQNARCHYSPQKPMGRPRKFYAVQSQQSESPTEDAVASSIPSLLANALSIIQNSGSASDNMTATPSPGSDYRTLQVQASSDSIDSNATTSSAHLGAVQYPTTRHLASFSERSLAADWSPEPFNLFVQPHLSGINLADTSDSVCSESHSRCHDYLRACFERLKSFNHTLLGGQISLYTVYGLFTSSHMIQCAIDCSTCCYFASSDLPNLRMIHEIVKQLLECWCNVFKHLSYNALSLIGSHSYVSGQPTDSAFRSEHVSRWKRHLQREALLGSRDSCLRADINTSVNMLSIAESLERKQAWHSNVCRGYRDVPAMALFSEFTAVGPAHPAEERDILVNRIAGDIKQAISFFKFSPEDFADRR